MSIENPQKDSKITCDFDLATKIIDKLLSVKFKPPGALVTLDEITEINPLIEANLVII
jgi:hypothetical protein